MHRHARATGLPLAAAALELADSDELPARTRATIAQLMAGFLRWRELAATVTPSDLLRTVLEETGYEAMLKAERSAESAGRLDNLAELARAMEDYETLGDFLEHVSLVMDNDANDSEDLLWLVKLPPVGGEYRPGPDSPWREVHLDAGFYRAGYRVVLLDPDWDHILASFSTESLAELIACIEKWLMNAPTGDLSPPA